MDSYEIVFKQSAQKELRTVPSSYLPALLQKISQLSKNPRPEGVQMLKGDRRWYRLRHADYRVIFEVQDELKKISIIKIGHRREIYDR